MFSIRTKVNKALPVSQHHGTPLVAFPVCELTGVISGDVYGPKVTPVDIPTIGIEEYGFSIRSNRPLLNVTVARGEHPPGSASPGKRVQMLPPVFLITTPHTTFAS